MDAAEITVLIGGVVFIGFIVWLWYGAPRRGSG